MRSRPRTAWKNCICRRYFTSSVRGIGSSFQLAITAPQINFIGYGTATAQSQTYKQWPVGPAQNNRLERRTLICIRNIILSTPQNNNYQLWTSNKQNTHQTTPNVICTQCPHPYKQNIPWNTNMILPRVLLTSRHFSDQTLGAARITRHKRHTTTFAMSTDTLQHHNTRKIHNWAQFESTHHHDWTHSDEQLGASTVCGPYGKRSSNANTHEMRIHNATGGAIRISAVSTGNWNVTTGGSASIVRRAPSLCVRSQMPVGYGVTE